MDMRLTFNLDAQGYERLRPTYTKTLFDDVIDFSGLNKNKEALEIGIGTGQATEPFLKTGCRVTAIELGDQMAQFTRDKFREFPRFEVLCGEFESTSLDENNYDLIYSASAFHWIAPETGIPKVLRLLKSTGAFAWFSNHPLPADEHYEIHAALQEIYGRYGSYFGGKSVLLNPPTKRRLMEEKRQSRRALFLQYGFCDITDTLYEGKRTLSGTDYIALLSTYSDHKSIPDEDRIPFLQEIKETIERHGDTFTLSDSMLLCMGRKP